MSTNGITTKNQPHPNSNASFKGLYYFTNNGRCLFIAVEVTLQGVAIIHELYPANAGSLSKFKQWCLTCSAYFNGGEKEVQQLYSQLMNQSRVIQLSNLHKILKP